MTNGEPLGSHRLQSSKVLLRVIGRSSEWRRGNQQKATLPRLPRQLVEFFRRPIALDRRMFRRRAQVLPNRQKIHIGLTQIVQHLMDLFVRLPQTDHE